MPQTETKDIGYREELYEKLREHLLQHATGIEHVDLWNHNVEFIEQETGWKRPAVFIEFHPVSWRLTSKPQGGTVEYRGKAMVSLHIVTDWSEASASVFRQCEYLHRRLHGLSGDCFRRFDLVESITNHNHEELVESVETYGCEVLKILRLS